MVHEVAKNPDTTEHAHEAEKKVISVQFCLYS